MGKIDERSRRMLHEALVRTLGEEPGDTLMGLLPGDEVATKDFVSTALHEQMNEMTWKFISWTSGMFALFVTVNVAVTAWLVHGS